MCLQIQIFPDYIPDSIYIELLYSCIEYPSQLINK